MAAGPESYVFIGNTKKPYLFKCYRVGSIFRDLPDFPYNQGVYIFAKQFHNNVSGLSDYEVLYVGQTESYKDRPVSEKHEKWEYAHRHGANCICIIAKEVTDTLDRKRIEKDIIDNYTPQCN